MSELALISALSFGLMFGLRVWALPGLVYLGFFKLKQHRWLWVLLIALYALRLIEPVCPAITEGRIVELNQKSVVVQSQSFNVLVRVEDSTRFALGDRLQGLHVTPFTESPSRYGFQIEPWMKARRMCGLSDVYTVQVSAQGFWAWVSRGGFNQDEQFVANLRSLLFQVQQDTMAPLWISLGLLFSVYLKVLKFSLQFTSQSVLKALVISMLFVWIGHAFGYPLAWWRVGVFEITRLWIASAEDRLSGRILLLLLIAPYGLTQLAFLIPLALNVVSVYRLSESPWLDRALVIQALLHRFYHQSFLGSILVYPGLRRLHQGLILCACITMGLPGLGRLFNALIQTVLAFERSWMIGEVRGNFGLLMGLLMGFWVGLKHKLASPVHSGLGIVLFTMGLSLTHIPMTGRVSFINVGQGDATLIQSPLNQTVILIDTGPKYAFDQLDSFLKARGIHHFTHVILTHDDSDHVGGLSALVQSYTIDQIGFEPLSILTGPLQLYPLMGQQMGNDNDDSLVFWLRLMRTRFLFLGDVSTRKEDELVAKYPQLTSDVIKIAHHGSLSSSSDRLLSWAEARIAWIGVGPNRYGHPHPSVIERLNLHRLLVYETQKHGDIELWITPWFSLQRDSFNKFLVF